MNILPEVEQNIIPLKKFYKKLHDNLIREEKKLESESVLLTLIKIRSNRVSKLLNASSIISSAFSESELNTLLENKYIRQADDKNKLNEYILTAHGIWVLEKLTKDLDENTIITFVQDKYLNFLDSGKPLNDNEKIIVLSMIAGRAFSEDSPMDLGDRKVCDHWLDIFLKSQSFLQNRKFIKQSGFSFEGRGNEHPVEFLVRRANNLPRKTNHIYSFLKNKKQYFLDVSEATNLSIVKLKHVMKLVFSEIEDMELNDSILQFCVNLAYEKGKFVKKDFKFVNAKCDDIIKAALREIYLD